MAENPYNEKDMFGTYDFRRAAWEEGRLVGRAEVNTPYRTSQRSIGPCDCDSQETCQCFDDGARKGRTEVLDGVKKILTQLVKETNLVSYTKFAESTLKDLEGLILQLGNRDTYSEWLKDQG